MLKTSLSFSCTGTLAEDTDAPLWFPCWLLLEGDTGLEKCLSQLGWVFFLPKWNLLLFYMDSQQIHKPQSWQLRYQTCHFWRNAFLCDGMTGNPCFMQPPCPPWEQILSNLLTGSYILFHPSFFPHFWEEENAALIITEKPDYFQCFYRLSIGYLRIESKHDPKDVHLCLMLWTESLGESLHPVYWDYLFCFNRFGIFVDINIILLCEIVLPPTF